MFPFCYRTLDKLDIQIHFNLLVIQNCTLVANGHHFRIKVQQICGGKKLVICEFSIRCMERR